jgi:hypothetical protein
VVVARDGGAHVVARRRFVVRGHTELLHEAMKLCAFAVTLVGHQ